MVDLLSRQSVPFGLIWSKSTDPKSANSGVKNSLFLEKKFIWNEAEKRCTCSEERLEVVRKLGAAGVARVHCDEDGAGRVQFDLGALEE